MRGARGIRAALGVGASIGALAFAAPVLAQKAAGAAAPGTTQIGEVIVTAQRRSENLQSVPIAVSAFSGDTLKQQRLNSGGDLILQVPNVTFSRGNFGGYNFQIRGIGTKLVASSADAAIGVHENNVPLTANTLADADFFDVQRVEVLRGPQGTQFGRNTTGGLVNVITNQPTDTYQGAFTGEYGNYNSKKFNGFVNLPLGHDVDLRIAGAYINRDGFGYNNITHHSVDGRDVYSTRATLAWHPTDNFKASVMWEHFGEDDNRDRVGKQLCITDPGLTSIGGVATHSNQNDYSQGCLPGDLHSAAALGEVNSAATLGGGLGVLTGLITGNAYQGKVQDPNLRHIESVFDPIYKHNNDLYTLNLVWNPTDKLEVTSTTSYSTDYGFTEADYNRATPTQTFNANVPTICSPFGPYGPYFGCNDTYNITDGNGYFNDPQVGNRNKFTTIDFGDATSRQFAQEVRIQSSFSGPFNFSLGGSYLRFNTLTDYYVTSNTLTAATVGLFNPSATLTYPLPFSGTLCPANGALDRLDCQYVDPNAIPTGVGHNYFDSRTKYALSSYAVFGEANYKIMDDLKLTVGLRYTNDHKQVTAFSPPLFTPGFGVGGLIAGVQKVTFGEVTGRVNLDWTPTTPFTDKTLVYASYSRGYKGGGFNPPQSPGQHLFPDTFAPEFIDAFEIGTKNSLLGGSLILNGDFFYYNYQGYQVSEIIQRTSVNVNINAKLYGVELESIWQPIHNLTFNANIGYLHTALDPTNSIDLTNLTQGDPNYQVIKNGLNFSDCIAPVSQLAQLQTAINNNDVPSSYLAGDILTAAVDPKSAGVCNGAFQHAPGLQDGAGYTKYGIVVNPIVPGMPAKLGGKQLPNSPNWTVSLGAQYRWEIGPWAATPRIDFYYQGASYARIFNAVNDRLNAYTNTNLSLTFNRPDWGLDIQFYVKNVTDEKVVTDQYITDDTSGLFTNIFLTDPRTSGVSVTKKF
jgi:outer membrane receptor protein involved in Fe transport